MARLVEIVREQLPAIAPSQSRYRVTAIPTERTIRFYTANGLVDKPSSGSGGRACYGYRHLLQILAIKYLQSQYLPLVKVRAMTEGVDNRDLEAMIPAVAAVTGTHRVVARDPGALTGPYKQASVGSPPTIAPGEPAPGSASAPMAEFSDAERMDLWHRVEVGPGVELHVHAAALNLEQRERLRGTLLRELGVLRGWFDGGEKT